MKNYLFYFIHPAKFHAFRLTINALMEKGHKVDVIIIKKDIVEDLVKSEGWNYTNIFPEGRRIKSLHIYLSALINLFKTLFRLNKLIKRKSYDLIITDDLATIIGRLKGIPTIFFTDDDLKAVPESILLAISSTHILCPEITQMGIFKYKKIGYKAIKAIAHLHPNHYQPDIKNIPESLQNRTKKYFVIRCVSVTSTHDVGNKGISNELLKKLVNFLSNYGEVVINSQRELPQDLQKYKIKIDVRKVTDLIAFSKLFISDSTTMCAEAAVLGVPSIEIDDWFSDFEQYKILNEKYKLLQGFYPDEEEKIFNYIKSLFSNPMIDEIFMNNRKKFVDNHIDVTKFMVWLFDNYPGSYIELKKNNNIQLKFQ